jgi:hypothetical protein
MLLRVHLPLEDSQPQPAEVSLAASLPVALNQAAKSPSNLPWSISWSQSVPWFL